MIFPAQSLRAALVFIILFLACVDASANDDSRLKKLASDFKPNAAESSAGAVILKRVTKVKLDNALKSSSTTYMAVALLNEEAANAYTTISITYNSYFQDVVLDYARIIDADKNIQSVSPGAVQIKSDPNPLAFSDVKSIVFALPAVGPGSIFEYQVSVRSIRNPFDGYWYDKWSPLKPKISAEGASIRVDPVRYAEYSLSMPNNIYSKYEFYGSDIKPDIKVNGNNRTMTWTVHGRKGIKYEDRMADFERLMPKLYLTTIKKWEQIDTWASGIYLNKTRLSAKMSGLAKSLTRNAKSQQEKAEAIYNYLQDNIRYISSDLDRGGMIPRSPDEVLGQRYGDCKDQSTLLTGMLNSVGIEAYPALVSTFPLQDVIQSLPNNYFNHMIVYMPNGKQGIWIDPAGQEADFPGMGWATSGRLAFIINGKGGQLRKTPEETPDDNRVNVTVKFYFKDKVLYSDITLDTAGTISAGYRNLIKNVPQSEADLRKMLAALYPVGEIVEFTQNAGEGRRKPFSARLKLKFGDQWHEGMKSLLLGGDMSFLLTNIAALNPAQGAEPRTHSYIMGDPMIIKYQTTYEFPSDVYRLDVNSTPGNYDNSQISLESQVVREGRNLSVIEKFTKHSSFIPANDYDTIVKATKDIRERSRWRVTLSSAENKTNVVDSSSDNRVNSSDPVELVRLAQESLDSGNYSATLDYARKATSLDPKNGKAYYLLGIAAGFMGEYDLSDKSLSRSKQLGYKN